MLNFAKLVPSCFMDPRGHATVAVLCVSRLSRNILFGVGGGWGWGWGWVMSDKLVGYVCY